MAPTSAVAGSRGSLKTTRMALVLMFAAWRSAGASVSGVTVRVAVALVAVPKLLLTTQVNTEPLSARVTTGRVRLAPSAPGTLVPSRVQR